MNKYIKKMAYDIPYAIAIVRGATQNLQLYGKVKFYKVDNGTFVVAEFIGLPLESSFLAFHIHNGNACTGNTEDEFANSGTHLNFNFLEHPLHTGDFPVLINNGGNAWEAFYTDRFMPENVIGYPVVVHEKTDDYHTQPSGGSGRKIGCGIIKKY